MFSIIGHIGDPMVRQNILGLAEHINRLEPDEELALTNSSGRELVPGLIYGTRNGVMALANADAAALVRPEFTVLNLVPHGSKFRPAAGKFAMMRTDGGVFTIGLPAYLSVGGRGVATPTLPSSPNKTFLVGIVKQTGLDDRDAIAVLDMLDPSGFVH